MKLRASITASGLCLCLSFTVLGGSSTYWHHNDLNQIEREGGAGTTLVEGTVDEPAIVEVDVNSEGYKRAAVLSSPGAGNFLFRREVEVDQGLNTIDVRAEDASGNQSTVKNYELTLPSVAKTYEYDLNGNLRFERDSGGNVLREFRWDAQNRLTHIIEGGNETEFEYDGQDRRRRIVERIGGVKQSNETYIWIGGEIVQKRNSSADTVLRDYYWFGFSEGANDYFYTRDHLGSVHEVVASDGTTIESRYDYDLWGNVTRTAGTGVESDILYTGHFYHSASDLHLAPYRAYDSELGLWLSRDPAGFIDGPNLYAYVLNNPVSYYDPTGEAVPLIIAGAWALFEIGSSAYDIYDAGSTLLNECASTSDKLISMAGLGAGAILPGGGYGAGTKAGLRQLDDTISAGTTVGRRGQSHRFPNPEGSPPRNVPGNVNGREYSGHAFDRMQERGVTPSVVENTIQNPTRRTPDPNAPGETIYYDSNNNITVVVDDASGRVITVRGGN